MLEGHVDVKMEHAEHAPFSETSKKVLYAGAIKNEYGIENLCRSFVEIARDNESLHIFGDGDDASVPADYAARYDNVIYHGSVPNSEVVKAELESCLLVNPRPSNQQFTKYSFPSKTLEYMASGTPVLMAKLEGAPREYDDYLFYFDDASENGLSQRLREVLDLPTHELEKLGCINKRFVLEKKNNVVQAKKVLDWIEMSFEK